MELEAAERQYLEDREGVALQATAAFFDLYIASRQLENATANAATNDTLYNLNKGRLEIGKIGENDLLQSELELLKARSALDNAKLDYQRALAAFRLAVNLEPDAAVEVVIPTAVPVIEADTAGRAARVEEPRPHQRPGIAAASGATRRGQGAARWRPRGHDERQRRLQSDRA